MKRREVLAVVSASAGLAGCLGRSGPSTCTQGPTAVGDVTADTEGDVTLQGTVVETMPSNDWFELADGTGRIRIVSSEIPDEDSCVRLGGVVTACPSSGADHCVDPWYWEPME
jgi:hypothetical protein